MEGMADTELFDRFVTHFQRNYTSDDERSLRYQTFKMHLGRIRARNSLPRVAGHTATHGINNFTDWTDHELAHLRGAKQGGEAFVEGAAYCPYDNKYPFNCSALFADTPVSFDWRDDPRSPISPVKNQGQCGGCWAFASTETAEAAWAIAGHPPIFGANSALSVEQVLGCDSGVSSGCAGGFLFQALLWLWDISLSKVGLVSEVDYEYSCINGCPQTPPCPSFGPPFATINSTCSCTYVNAEDSMASALYKYGPLAVVVDADSWYSYTGGIIRSHCSSYVNTGDHAVQITGFGVDDTTVPPTPYWWVRNSWGATWGLGGYLQVYRGDNTCGVANNASYAFSDAL